jgi:hypothetical protein
MRKSKSFSKSVDFRERPGDVELWELSLTDASLLTAELVFKPGFSVAFTSWSFGQR